MIFQSNSEIQIIVDDSGFRCRIIISVAFIQHNGRFDEDGKAMCKAFGDVKLELVFGRKLNTVPLAVCWRAVPDIDGNIIDRAFEHSDQLALCIRLKLAMQSADNPVGRF